MQDNHCKIRRISKSRLEDLGKLNPPFQKHNLGEHKPKSADIVGDMAQKLQNTGLIRLFMYYCRSHITFIGLINYCKL